MPQRETLQQIQKFATLGGASLLVFTSVFALTKSKTIRGAAMPIVSILVGLSAFNYAVGR